MITRRSHGIARLTTGLHAEAAFLASNAGTMDPLSSLSMVVFRVKLSYGSVQLFLEKAYVLKNTGDGCSPTHAATPGT